MRRAHWAHADRFIDDDELQQRILEHLESDPAFWTGRRYRRALVSVEVEDGYVTLTGVVQTPMDRRKLDILARAVGALGVDNRLRVDADLARES